MFQGSRFVQALVLEKWPQAMNDGCRLKWEVDDWQQRMSAPQKALTASRAEVPKAPAAHAVPPAAPAEGPGARDFCIRARGCSCSL